MNTAGMFVDSVWLVGLVLLTALLVYINTGPRAR